MPNSTLQSNFLLQKKKKNLISIFFLTYFSLFLIYSLYIKNYEFSFYILFYVCLIFLLNLFFSRFLSVYWKTYFSISIFLIIHLLGGVVHIDGVRLYDYFIFGYIRYDWLVHVVGGGLSAVIALDFLQSYFLKKKIKKSILFLVTVLIASGLGVFNEILEFVSVLFLDAGKAVGDYHNNMQDLVNNLIGAALVTYFLIRKK